MRVVERVVAILESLDGPFALIGGRAVSARGFPWMTLDYDFLCANARVLSEETWAGLARAGSAERKHSLTPYLHFYNHHRAHSSLGDHPPISRLTRNNVLTRNS